MEKLKISSGDFNPKPAPVTWPAAAPLPPDMGKHKWEMYYTCTHTHAHQYITWEIRLDNRWSAGDVTLKKRGKWLKR